MKRRINLPIILSHNTHTGIVTFADPKMGGRDMMIVGLKREVPSGETYAFADIAWVKAVLHFGDIESLKVTIDCLTQALKRWDGES